MIIKPKKIEVPEKDPFRNDALDREESALALTEFVLSTEEPLVICIDAPWGQGKTTFLKMWQQQLKDSGIHTIYFNAWENDFSDDAMVSLIGEISASLSELDEKDKSRVKVYFDKAKRIAKSLGKRSIPLVVNIGTLGALNADKLVEQTLAKFAESLAKDQIKQYESSKNSIQEFRKALHAFAANISVKKDCKSNQKTRKPLVFVIDELDRCRPNYAIEILEKAKHFFNVENLIFVLGAHKGQLGISIKSIYGEGLDANGYLRRFIDIDYHLPSPDKGKFVTVLFQKYGFPEYFSQKKGRELEYEYRHALEMFGELFELYRLTLREQEHCCSLLSLAIKTTPYNYDLYPLYLCFLIVLKIKEPNLYNGFISNQLSPQEILDHISNLPGGDDLLENNYGAVLEAYIITRESRESRQSNYNKASAKYKEIANSDSSSEQEKRRAEYILRMMSRNYLDGDILPYLVEKIEIATRFKS